MPELTPSEAKALSHCVARFTDAFRSEVADVIREQFRGYEPPEVTELIGQLSLLGRQLELRQPHVQIHDTQGPLLKRILIDLRRDRRHGDRGAAAEGGERRHDPAPQARGPRAGAADGRALVRGHARAAGAAADGLHVDPARRGAYRFGGDEYMITLPNASRASAVDFLRALQERLARRRYRRVERAPTISVGLCVADTDCFVTDREIQGRANLAKNHAKATEKGRIAAYDGELFRPDDLVLV